MPNQDTINTNTHRLIKNTGFMFFRMLVVMVVGLFTSRLILKYLGVEDFGIYNVVGSVIVLFSFLKQTLNAATSRFLSFEIGRGDSEGIKRIFSMSINCHIILAVILVFVLEIVGFWFLNTHLNIPNGRLYAANWVFQFSLLSFFLGIVFTPYNSAIIAYERMDFYALISFVEALLKLIIVYCLLISSFDRLVVYSFLLMCVTLVNGLFNYFFCRCKFSDCKYRLFWNKTIFKQIMSFSGWSLTVSTVDVGTNQGMNICFNIFLGVVANASMGIANQVIAQLSQFIRSFSTAYNPQIIKSYAAKQYDYFMTLIFSASKISYMILFFVSLPIVLNIEFILRVWLGNYPSMAPGFIKAIIVYCLIDVSQAPLWQAVHATGNIKVHELLMSSIKIFTLPIAYILLRIGFSGQLVLFSWAGINLCCAVARTLYLRKLINLDVLKYLTSVVAKIAIVTILAFPLPYYLSTVCGQGWTNFFVVSVVSFILTGGLIFFIGLNKVERNFIYSTPIIKRLFHIKENHE